eukprot:3417418-Amphidinium_carterae.1
MDCSRQEGSVAPWVPCEDDVLAAAFSYLQPAAKDPDHFVGRRATVFIALASRISSLTLGAVMGEWSSRPQGVFAVGRLLLVLLYTVHGS